MRDYEGVRGSVCPAKKQCGGLISWQDHCWQQQGKVPHTAWCQQPFHSLDGGQLCCQRARRLHGAHAVCAVGAAGQVAARGKRGVAEKDEWRVGRQRQGEAWMTDSWQ